MLDTLWQAFALTACVAAFGLVAWDAYLREQRSGRSRLLGLLAIAFTVAGGLALASKSLLWLPALAGTLASLALARKLDAR